jgi:hypothetical protein
MTAIDPDIADARTAGLASAEAGTGAQEADGTEPAPSRASLLLLGSGTAALLLAGLLLWWREGDRLFTDGLIAAIVACF